MTDTSADAHNEETRVDREPPVFPRVSGSADADADADLRPGKPVAPLFTAAGTHAEPVEHVEPLPTAAPAGAAQARWRWAVAALATVAVVGVIGAFFLLAGPRAGTPSTVARYAPDDTVVYVEMRLDLPGDQRDRLASFMAHFPGFDDPATFEQKIDDTLNEMLHGSGTGLDWYADVDPWFAGQIALFSSTVNPTPGTPPSMTAALAVKDRVRLDELIGQRVAGTDATHEEYQGATIWTVRVAPGAELLSFAVTDEVLLAGARAEDIKDALDVRADRRGGLADDQFFVQQLAALHGDRLATLYVDGRAAADSMSGQIGQAIPGGGVLDWLVDVSSVRVLGEIRAEGDHLALTTRTERSAEANLPPLPANRSTNLAQSMPADSLFYGELRDVGRSIGFAIEQSLTAIPSGGGIPVDLRGLEQLLGTAPADFFDFLGDVAVAAAYTGDRVDAGLIATVDDEVIARQRVDRLLTTLRSLAQFGTDISFEEQQHGDATLTVISLGSLGSGADIGSLAVTVSGGRLLIGVDDFVLNALDRTSDASLAARPEYQAALQAGGTSNAGVMFLDVAAARDVLERLMPGGPNPTYEQEMKPFVEPLSHLAVITTTEGSTTVTHVFLYVE